MKKKLKKKLEKRHGFKSYRKYREWKKILDFGIQKFGSNFYDFFVTGKHHSQEHLNGTGVDTLVVTYSKTGKAILDENIYYGCYPSSISSSGSDTVETSVSFDLSDISIAETSDIIKNYQDWLDAVKD